MRKVAFDFKLGREEGVVIKTNAKSIRVKFEFNGKTIEITRHVEKHHVEDIV
jgi:hypothetical protein